MNVVLSCCSQSVVKDDVLPDNTKIPNGAVIIFSPCVFVLLICLLILLQMRSGEPNAFGAQMRKSFVQNDGLM